MDIFQEWKLKVREEKIVDSNHHGSQNVLDSIGGKKNHDRYIMIDFVSMYVTLRA